MLSLGPIAFAAPWVLTALIALPALWWLIRAVPPRPRRHAFPPVRLLAGLGPSEPPPDKTPLWILILRMVLATLLILALAGPVVNPTSRFVGAGPVLIVVDNGWEAAGRWRDRVASLDKLLAKADRERRSVILLPTAPPLAGLPADQAARLPAPVSAADARGGLPSLTPRPWPADHAATAARAKAPPDAGQDSALATVVWLSDGLRRDGTTALRDALATLAPLDIRTDADTDYPMAMLPVEQSGLDLAVRLVRPARPFAATVTVRALGADGRRLASAPAPFVAEAETAIATLSLPQQIRNEVARLDVDGVDGAGTTVLLDARSGRPAVGLIGAGGGTGIQPLRSPLYFLRRALEPFADLREGEPGDLIDGGATMLVMADVGRLLPDQAARIGDWLDDRGGVLVRFAGPRMATGTDDLVPVRLRSGDRSFGGALSWEEPQGLGAFSDASPFADLIIPEDVTVGRQLLAVPAVDLAEKTWARLADGTPIVTAKRQGAGWIVLFHTTANTEWSSLPLSGLFVDMLRRLLPLARNPGQSSTAARPPMLQPVTLLDGFGRAGDPDPAVAAIPAANFDGMTAGPTAPPGLYGPDASPLALNLASGNGPIDAGYRFAEAGWSGTGGLGDRAGGERELKPALLTAALLLALIDLVISFMMRGLAPGWRWRTTALAVAAGLTVGLAPPHPAAATERLDDGFVIDATAKTRIAYALTGNDTVDRMSEAGLLRLGRLLEQRTAVRLGDPRGIRPDRDPIALFPLIYWPVPRDARELTPDGLTNLNGYLRSGGMILFDTGVGDEAERSQGLENPLSREALRRLIGALDTPPLAPVDQTHVLAKSFYLLDRFPGRVTGRRVWVEKASVGDNGVASGIIIGGHDWASAWATDGSGTPFVATLVGGERQRELAYRFGINLVMYALTGTYKSDQLHLPAVLNRLGE